MEGFDSLSGHEAMDKGFRNCMGCELRFHQFDKNQDTATDMEAQAEAFQKF